MVKMTDAEFKVMENLEIIKDIAEMIMSSQAGNVIIVNMNRDEMKNKFYENNVLISRTISNVEGIKVGMKSQSLNQAIMLNDKESIIKMLNMALDKDKSVENCDKVWMTSYSELHGNANEKVMMEMGEFETYMAL